MTKRPDPRRDHSERRSPMPPAMTMADPRTVSGVGVVVSAPEVNSMKKCDTAGGLRKINTQNRTKCHANT